MTVVTPETSNTQSQGEIDQETSLVQAVRKFVEVTGERSFLEEVVEGRSVLERLELALDYLLAHRFDREHSLLWGATTAHWGDVQPEHEWGVELDANSHPAIDIYDNAMFIIALNDLLHLLGPNSERTTRWREVRDQVKNAIRGNVVSHTLASTAIEWHPKDDDHPPIP